jgi:cold shock protein
MQPVTVFGVVRFFDPRGYGFIRPNDGSQDIFFHVSELPGERGKRFIKDDQPVSYEIGSYRGKTAAKNVRPVHSDNGGVL